ncbi:MAG: phage integrase N-terminal SAM-like domain-containing protein [Oscillospiraceae bacterium]|nr:phage integrase N-terminal SAM-like domain-containing protein [Oscillospiraceae bacterium]
MKCYDFDWQINEFMVYCRSTQLRERTMYSYEQTLRLFERWLCDELKIYSVDKVTENMIRKYINDLQERGKYTFFVNDLSKVKNYPERRRDFRKPVSVTTINNYMENLWGSIAFYIVLRYNDCATQILYFHLASVHFYFGKNAGSVFVRLQRGNEFVSQQ